MAVGGGEVVESLRSRGKTIGKGRDIGIAAHFIISNDSKNRGASAEFANGYSPVFGKAVEPDDPFPPF